uniref:Uncharacterized protein n=1 Tax=Aureoumbra lagunensis TaxID=44058 RepID=A0A7S3K6E9_9STRA
MGGYLLVQAFYKQAFASATKHQLLSFLMVAAYTNRTAVLPMARVGEPAYVGLPERGFMSLERYFDINSLIRRWPCLRVMKYEEFIRIRKGQRPVDVALQLGFPPNAKPSRNGFIEMRCGKRSRPLMAMGVRFACVDLKIAASAMATLGGETFKDLAIMITNWSQKIVGLGDPISPLFGDAFTHRGGCHDVSTGPHRAFPELANEWSTKAKNFLLTSKKQNDNLVCVHVRAEKLASAATGPEKRSQWILQNNFAKSSEWTSPYMERCLSNIATIAQNARFNKSALLLISDTDARHGTPSNQGSAHFREWRNRGETILRAALPDAIGYCPTHAYGDPECALVEAAACRTSSLVLRFGSGTFSEFIVGDGPNHPPSIQYLNCSHIAAAATSLIGETVHTRK